MNGTDWRVSLAKFLDALTELAKIGAAALKEELAKKGDGNGRKH